jgi:hypothetical protein
VSFTRVAGQAFAALRKRVYSMARGWKLKEVMAILNLRGAMGRAAEHP